MKEIKFKNGLRAFVDDEDFELVDKFTWYCEPHGRTFRSYMAKDRNIDGKRTRKKIFLHRFILKAEKGQIIDHVDGNALNNQKSNLRFCTHSQNIMNGPRRIGSSSKFLGVSRRQFKNSLKWKTQYQLNGKNHYVGVYESEKEAALVYNVCASFAFREFARLNKL